MISVVFTHTRTSPGESCIRTQAHGRQVTSMFCENEVLNYFASQRVFMNVWKLIQNKNAELNDVQEKKHLFVRDG